MVMVSASFELTPTELEVLEYEAEAENMTVDAMVGWMVRQNIPSLLDVVVEKDGRRDELMRKLNEENAR